MAAPVPLLSTPLLADTVADQVDDRAVQLLLKLALTKEKSEEEREERRRQEEVAEHERRMCVLDRRVAADEQLTPEESYAWRAWAGHLPGGKRKRKKRRKKKLPKSSSFLRLSRCSSNCVPSCCRLQACDARHHGQYGPEGIMCRRAENCGLPQSQFLAGRRFPGAVQRPISMVLLFSRP